MDFYELVAFGVMGFLGGFLSVFYAFYKLENSTILEDSLHSFVDSLANNEESQKFLYQIGGIIGAGVKGGVGLDTATRSRGGRFKWQDLALNLASEFIGKTLQNPAPSPEPLPLPQSKDISAKKLSDKW